MSSVPIAAASRNMSACRVQAMSQVGCRLMVASSANTSRPRPPEACGAIALALATKAAMSADADDCDTASVEDLGMVGSRDIRTHNQDESDVARKGRAVNRAALPQFTLGVYCATLAGSAALLCWE